MKHFVIEDTHNSWLYCFTNPLELGTRVSLSHRQPYVSSNTLDIEGGNITLDKSVVQINQKTEHKTLGMNYNPLTDTITNHSASSNCNKKTATKVFYPLGLLCPVTIIPQLLMQKTWKESLDWDQPVLRSINAERIRFVRAFEW